MSEPKKYILNHIPGAFKMDDHWMHPQDNRMAPAPAGDYVRYEDYARLKAEVEKLNATLQQAYVDFEKRIQKEAAHPACIKLNRLVGDKNNEIHRLKAEVERLTAFTTRTIIPNEELQAQVERLTKAGDAMLSEWSSGDEKDAKNFRKALVMWHIAKEGKQP